MRSLTIEPTHRLQQENQDLKTTQSQEIARLKWREGQQAQEIAELRATVEAWEPVKKEIEKLRELLDGKV